MAVLLRLGTNMPFPHFFAENIFNGPSFLEPLPDGADRQTKPLTKVGHARCFSIYGNKRTSPGVSGLFCGSGPAAVVFKIAQIVISPFYRKARRAFAHIVKKVLKGCPSLTHRNSTPCVPFVASAPSFHVAPYSVRSRSRPVGVVFRKTITRAISLKTATRFAKTIEQTRVVGFKFSSAVAMHDASGFSIAADSLSEHDASCKSRSWRDSLFGRHNNGIDVVVFSGGRTASTICPPRFSQLLAGGQGD